MSQRDYGGFLFGQVLRGLFGWLMVGIVWAGQPMPQRDQLNQELTGFSREEMTLVWALFRAYPEGRNLLLKSRRKLRVATNQELQEIFRFCTNEEIGKWQDRRGLYRREVAQFYRTKGEGGAWREITHEGKAKLEDPEQYPVIAERRSATEGFEQLEVAFRPTICLRRGLTHIQAFLVLVHELTHLNGLPFFEEVDLLGLAKRGDRMAYHYDQLARQGGELEAYLAQVKAFQWLRETYELNGRLILEGFLGSGGQLHNKDRKAFMDHLLFEADYFSEQEFQLDSEVYHQYNRAYSWWEYLAKVIEAYEAQYTELEKQLVEANLLLEKARVQGNQTQTKEINAAIQGLRKALSINRAYLARLTREHRHYRTFLDALDREYPNNQVSEPGLK